MLSEKGYYATQSANYYEYIVHSVCSIHGFYQSIDLSPTFVRNINYLQDI